MTIRVADPLRDAGMDGDDPAPAADRPWVLMRIGAQLVALSVAHVQEMVRVPRVTQLPGSPSWVRGLIDLRGSVMPLVDGRRRLGQQSRSEEVETFIAMLQQREQDHRAWVSELEACVAEKRTFTLTTDPHACAFGRWYDGFRTDDLLLSTQLRRFGPPHATIHAVGGEVARLMAAGHYDGARGVVESARQTLGTLLRLFAETYDALRDSSREIAVITREGNCRLAVAVDGVESVERLPAGTIEPVPIAEAPGDAAPRIARRQKDDAVVVLLTMASVA